MTIPDDRTLQRLQIAEDTHGQRVHEWIDEGMPADMLGKTRDMKTFRQRQAERPPEVPTNIERQNRRSVLRSEQATADISRAGETGVPESVREMISSTGQSLDASIQRAIMHRDCLLAYHECDTDVDGYRAEDTFNAGLFAPLLELF